MKKILVKLLLFVFIVCVCVGCNNEDLDVIDSDVNNSISDEIDEGRTDGDNEEYIVDTLSINKIDDNNYEFVYKDEVFKTVYTNGSWKVYNSYKITNSNDIKKICKTLIDIYPVYGRDGASYRTEIDMAYEWLQHNIVYEILPEGNLFKESAKDVDLDPDDQGKNFIEIYEDRTGEKFNFSNILK